ncbi:DUF975 family protein [Lactobacillus sp. ESL0684]|uniref:DUF975 family protein n=1 Tax=Lactobacillus sp. ESL0684 TaxID=2983213 RepID=UPI0032AED297
MTRAELKENAKAKLHGNWGWAATIGLIMIIIYIIFGLITFSTTSDSFDLASYNKQLAGNFSSSNFWAGRANNFGSNFIIGFLMLSAAIVFLHFLEGRKDHAIGGAFSVFTDGRFVPEFLNYLLSYIFQWLWTLLLVIPGLVKSYSYAMTPYIVNDLVASGQEVGPTTGISASRELMDGHKWELFVLDLSFIGWDILAVLTLGIGFIWLIPYEQTTKANFYRNIAGDKFRTIQ